MGSQNFRGSTAVVGVGVEGFSHYEDVTAMAMAHTAVQRCLNDSGLDRAQIDGLLVHQGTPGGVDVDLAAKQLGLNVRFGSQTNTRGRHAATVIQHAAMALRHELADYVLCLMAWKRPPGGKQAPAFQENLRDGGGAHGEVLTGYLSGALGPAALIAQRYFHRYGIERDKLGAVPVAFRKHAQLNPQAFITHPLSREDYAREQYTVEPIRPSDRNTFVDGAVALLLTTSDRAVNGSQLPVYLLGMQGASYGPEEQAFSRPGLGVGQSSEHDFSGQPQEHLAYRMAGVQPRDIELLQCYDAYSFQVLLTLERFGFCEPGTAADWVQDGRIELGGELPINTNGGSLSEGHFHGWGHTVELVRQLRGTAGLRQIPDVSIAQYAASNGDSIVYGNIV